MTDNILKNLDLTKSDDFQKAIKFIREHGTNLGNDAGFCYDDYMLVMDPADAGFSASIFHDATMYNGNWHISKFCENGGRWSINCYPATNAAFSKQNVKNITTVPVDIDIINNIIKYCEDQTVYDKLGRYGDFYYKLKRLTQK
ncbi:hypothetical protein [uncultured Methanobrevibacter sp.]|uniref:hypothetical protein n=1 Tax=uncultured Methanobrevibacter sp. TaxID=253161 RepID=UPI0025DBB0F2|nr:hypothetical protein [uncultured Methanobrevibacter sp.]